MIKFYNIADELKAKGHYVQGDWKHSLNCVRFHNKGETELHFFTKCKLFHELAKRGQTVFTELDFKYRGVCDLYWLEENIVIELESNLTTKSKTLKEEQYSGMNLIVFDLKKQEFPEMLAKLGLTD